MAAGAASQESLVRRVHVERVRVERRGEHKAAQVEHRQRHGPKRDEAAHWHTMLEELRIGCRCVAEAEQSDCPQSPALANDVPTDFVGLGQDGGLPSSKPASNVLAPGGMRLQRSSISHRSPVKPMRHTHAPPAQHPATQLGAALVSAALEAGSETGVQFPPPTVDSDRPETTIDGHGIVISTLPCEARHRQHHHCHSRQQAVKRQQQHHQRPDPRRGLGHLQPQPRQARPRRRRPRARVEQPLRYSHRPSRQTAPRILHWTRCHNEGRHMRLRLAGAHSTAAQAPNSR